MLNRKDGASAGKSAQMMSPKNPSTTKPSLLNMSINTSSFPEFTLESNSSAAILEPHTSIVDREHLMSLTSGLGGMHSPKSTILERSYEADDVDEMSVGEEPPSALNHTASKEAIPEGVPTNVPKSSQSKSAGKVGRNTRNHILVFPNLKE